jgi:hypothetical protein
MHLMAYTSTNALMAYTFTRSTNALIVHTKKEKMKKGKCNFRVSKT